MGIGTILTIIGAGMKIAAAFIGDYFLAKWMTALRVWLRKFAWESLKREMELEYKRVTDEFEDINSDRPDLKKNGQGH